jgi:NADH-quinone oxidoreductase subunit G
VQRLRPKDNAGVNQYWMCDDGMMSYKRYHEGRIRNPQIRVANNRMAETDLDDALEAAGNALKRLSGDKVAVVLSAQHGSEDNLALVRLARELGSSKLYLAALGGWEGDKILRDADNNPNRRGAELVAGGPLAPLSKLLEDVQAGAVEGVIALGWASAEDSVALAPLARLKAMVSLTSNEGALPGVAGVVIPVASHAESFGTFVNRKNVAQQFKRAVFAPEGIKPAWEAIAALSRAVGKDLGLTSINDVRAQLRQLPSTAQQEAQV